MGRMFRNQNRILLGASLENRIQQGARITAKRYYFDRELGMVRSRKAKEA